MADEPVTLGAGCRDGTRLCHLELAADTDVTLQLDGVPCEKVAPGYRCGAMSLYTEAPQKLFYLPGPRLGNLTLFRRGINVASQRVALPHTNAAELVAWREKVLAPAPVKMVAADLSDVLRIPDDQKRMEALVRIGRFAEAVAIIDRIDSDAAKVKALADIVTAMAEAGERAEAMKAARRMRDLADDHPEALCNTARALLVLGLRDEAAVAVKDALEVVDAKDERYEIYGKRKDNLLARIANLLAELQQPALARQVIAQTVQLTKRGLGYGQEVFGSLATASMRLGEVVQGIEFLGRAHDLYSEAAAVREFVPALLDAGHIDVAVQVLEKLPGWPHDKFRALQTLIVGLIRAGRYERAMVLVAQIREKEAREFIDQHLKESGSLGFHPEGIVTAFAAADQFDRAVWAAELCGIAIRPIVEQIPAVSITSMSREALEKLRLPVALVLGRVLNDAPLNVDQFTDPLVGSGQFRVYSRMVKDETEFHAAVTAVHADAGAPIHTLVLAGEMNAVAPVGMVDLGDELGTVNLWVHLHLDTEPYCEKGCVILGSDDAATLGEAGAIDSDDFAQGDFAGFSAHVDPTGQLLLAACVTGAGTRRGQNLANAFARIMPPTFAIFSAQEHDGLRSVVVRPNRRLHIAWFHGAAYNTKGRFGVRVRQPVKRPWLEVK